MSGGVDSSVAAYLMKQKGYECAGAAMKLFNEDTENAEDNNNSGAGGDKSCCSLEDIEDARSVAHRLDIPFYVFNFTVDFKKRVIEKFITTYQTGGTPNPCIDCNRYLKFEKFFERAKQLDIDYVATGHYAKIEYDDKKRRYILKKAADSSKDQSYVLYTMTQEQLRCTKFPLGNLNKSETREIAALQGFGNARKRDSQDICFVRDNDYAKFIEQSTDKKYAEGDFVDMRGNVLGRHKGLIRYTIGQRKGLGVSCKKPLYVYSKNIEDNTVTLCEDEALFTKSLRAADFNWIAYDAPASPVRVKAKIRYAQAEQWATAEPFSDNTVRIDFDEPQRAPTKGQSVVLYNGDIVVGGGVII